MQWLWQCCLFKRRFRFLFCDYKHISELSPMNHTFSVWWHYSRWLIAARYSGFLSRVSKLQQLLSPKTTQHVARSSRKYWRHAAIFKRKCQHHTNHCINRNHNSIVKVDQLAPFSCARSACTVHTVGKLLKEILWYKLNLFAWMRFL